MPLQLLLHAILLLKYSRGAAFINDAPRVRLGLASLSQPSQRASYSQSGTLQREIQQSRSLIFSTYSNSNYPSDENEDEKGTTTTTTTSVASQAALIAGTTIGGGFLALPAATAPCGAAPAALGLIGVWLFLLGGALSLSNAIFMMKQNGLQVDEKKSMMQAQKKDLSLFSLIRECFGGTAGILGGVLFLLLIKVTLIAQLSKVGVLLEGALPIFNRQFWTFLFSVSITTVCLVGKERKIERINDGLTTMMLVSFATLVALAGGSGWSLDGLIRSDYSSLLPSFSSSTNSSPWAIPIFIQLLIYNEVVPLVASRLGDEGKVRKAIIFGSSVPLIMCLVWSCVALGLVPYEPASVASGMMYDPLTNLGDAVLSTGGYIRKIFLGSVNTLAGSAICTTVIGSILASTQYFDDMITSLIGLRNGNAGKSDNTTRYNSDTANDASGIYRKIVSHTLTIAPSAIIALCGSSELYFRATSFAGEFPCTLLYGLIPPLCNLRLRWKYSQKERATIHNMKDVALQIVLATISVGILVVSSFSSY